MRPNTIFMLDMGRSRRCTRGGVSRQPLARGVKVERLSLHTHLYYFPILSTWLKINLLLIVHRGRNLHRVFWRKPLDPSRRDIRPIKGVHRWEALRCPTFSTFIWAKTVHLNLLLRRSERFLAHGLRLAVSVLVGVLAAQSLLVPLTLAPLPKPGAATIRV